MIIETLDLENWLAFAGRFELDLPTGAVAVVGRYADDPQRSNWSGKTALLEAIEWCLFGVHRKRYDDEIIFAGAEFVRVTLAIAGTVEIDGKLRAGTIQVERTRKLGKPTRLSLVAGGERWEKKAAQEKLEEILGFDGSDYRETVCFAQGDTEAIVEKTSGERRKVVGAWLELDAWLRVASRARVKVRTLADRHRELRVELAAHAKTDAAAPSVEELGTDVEKAKALELESREALELVDKRLELVAAMEIARLDRDKLAEVVADGKTLKAELTGATVDGLEAGRAGLAKAAAEEETKSKALRDAVGLAQGNFDGECPVTCEECPVAEDVRANKAAALTKAERLRSEHKVARDNRDTWKSEVSGLESQEREFDRKRGRFKSLVEQARALKASADRYSETDELDETAVQRLKFDRSRYREAMAKARAATEVAEKTLADLHALRETLSEVEGELDDLAGELKIANLAARSVGPSGIPARIAEAQLGVLEERANALLEGSGLSFMFGWDRVTRDLAKRCFECGYAYKGTKDKSCPACDAVRVMKRADELEILVDDGSVAVEDVKAKSGGAKVLIASAIRLSAGAMLREIRGSRCAWAQVDEPFGALDARNRRDLARTFSGMLGAVGLEQAFVVSHDSHLLDGLPGRIEVVRVGDRSTVEVIR